jgi:hypothetical protein
MVSLEEIMNRLQSHPVIAFSLLLVFPIGLFAQGGSAPVIVSATVNYLNSPWQITISGRNFKPLGASPKIFFNNQSLEVQPDYTNQKVVAWLPSPNPAPGTYLIKVTNSKKASSTAYITIGTAGPMGAIDQPIEFNVDCANGGRLIDALDQIGNRVAKTTININGFCDGQVNLSQSNILFHAAANSSNAGIGYLFLFGAQRIRLEDLKLGKLEATYNAAFEAVNLRVDQPDGPGIFVHDSSSGILFDPILTNCHSFCIEVGSGGYLQVIRGILSGQVEYSGVTVYNGGSIDISGTVMQGLGTGLEVGAGGSAYLDSATLELGTGNAITSGGTVIMLQTKIKNNTGVGVMVQPGGKAVILSGTEISGNGSGITARGGVLDISHATILGNNGPGIVGRNASSLLLWDTLISGNQGDGIQLGDVSFMEARGTSTISNNTGWGLYCSPAPSVAQYTGNPSFSVTGNVKGEISCAEATK